MTQENNVLTGDVAAMGARYSNAIAFTHTAILNGQTVALGSAVAAGLTLAAMVKPLPVPDAKGIIPVAIKYDAARDLLAFDFKASKAANDDFIERTLTAGRGFANWLFAKNRDLYVAVFSAFDLNEADGHAGAVQHVLNVLATDYGIRDRKAMATLWHKAKASKAAYDGVSRAVAAIAKDEIAGTGERLAAALITELSPETLAAFATAFAVANGARLKLLADAGAAAAAQGADTTALAG